MSNEEEATTKEISEEGPEIKLDVFAERDAQFHRAIVACEKLFQDKNRQYGDAISETGVLGSAVELVGIVARFKKLVIRDSSSGSNFKKNLMEIAKDAVIYSVIMMVMISENNWNGRD